MAARNLHWYSLNAGRSYPVDEAATLLSDSGELLPSDIIVDCHLTFPETAARYAYIGAVTVSAGAVSVIIMGSDVPVRQATCSSEESEEVGVPLASISMAKTNLVTGRNYPLVAMYPGVGGWIVFGEGVTNKRGDSSLYYKGKFSSVVQSGLNPRAARSYRGLPIPSIAKMGESVLLTGIVLLKGGTDFEIVQETRTIEGDEVNAIIFRLVSKSPGGSDRNVFQVYSGQCLPRPETGNCDGDPIEQINGATPDCCGIITVNFAGCASVKLTTDGHGIVVDCDVGMTDVCAGPDNLPANDGSLPNEREGEC